MTEHGTGPRLRRDGVSDLLGELLHVGIVVERLDAACAAFERLVGRPPSRFWESAVGVRVAFFEVGGTSLELVEYTGPIVERFGPTLARREGVHHLCFRVDDLDAALAEVRGRGFSVVPGFPVEGAHGRIAFLDPEPETGLITELCQVRVAEGRGAEAPPSEASER